MVLQPTAKGEEDDAAEHARRRDDGGHAAQSPGAGRPPPGLPSAGSPPWLADGAQPQSPDAQPSGSHGPLVGGSLAFARASPVGPLDNLTKLGEQPGRGILAAGHAHSVLSPLLAGAHRQLFHRLVAVPDTELSRISAAALPSFRSWSRRSSPPGRSWSPKWHAASTSRIHHPPHWVQQRTE